MSVLSPNAIPNLLQAFQSIYNQPQNTAINPYNLPGATGMTGQYILPGVNAATPGAGTGIPQYSFSDLLAQIQQNPSSTGAPMGVLPPSLAASQPPAPGGTGQPQAPAAPAPGPAMWTAFGTPGNWMFMNQATGQTGKPQGTDYVMTPGSGGVPYSQFQTQLFPSMAPSPGSTGFGAQAGSNA